jgi:SAM-dependent methyltransferase
MAETNDYGIRHYGDQIADVYDRFYPSCDPAAIAALKELVGSGRALELGIGTGRVALPLAATGVPVSGIDASEAMVGRLRSKPGGTEIPVVMGDFADVAVEGPFALVYVVFNTFFGLLTQEDQVRCFRNVAKRLDSGGVFVLETFVPDPGRYRGDQDVRVIAQNEGEVRLDVSQLDSARQVVTATHVTLGSRGNQFFPVKLRYAWPAEMDLMAQLAGMQLRERWGHWDRRPFTSASGKHISIYGRAV